MNELPASMNILRVVSCTLRIRIVLEICKVALLVREMASKTPTLAGSYPKESSMPPVRLTEALEMDAVCGETLAPEVPNAGTPEGFQFAALFQLLSSAPVHSY